MPVITIEASKMEKAQKEALIASLTKASSEILAIPEQAFVVLIKENEPDNIGTGGESLTTVRARRASK